MECKICSGAVVKRMDPELNLTVPNDFPLRGNLGLAICTSCGFVFNDSSSSESDYINYYKSLNKHHHRAGALKDIDISYFTELLRFLTERAEFHIDGSAVLDYGSGALLFSEIARERGAKHAINYDIGQPGVEGKYDLVISTHCFEHILDPVSAFRDLARHVADDGSVCIAVPDLDRYQEAYYGPYAHFDLEHINHFSQSSLQRLFELNGFDVVAVRHTDRMVTATLAYSEVLVVGRKAASLRRPSIPHHAAASATQTVAALLDRSKHDMSVMLSAFEAVVEESSRDGNSVIGIYGLSSYAFRFIGALERHNLMRYISFLADSDSRISRYQLGNHWIFDKDAFRAYLKSQTIRGKKVYAIIVAINGHRIKQMFEDEFDDNGLVVKLLPPECQNRKGH